MWFLAYTFTRMYKFFFAMLLIIVPYTFAVISEFVFELIPSYSPEMLIDTFLTGGIMRLVFYYLIFFLAAYIAFVHTKREVPLGRMSSYERAFGYGLFFVIALLMGTTFYLYGIPVLNEMSRFAYWQGEAGEDPLLLFGKNQMPMCVLFFSIIYINFPKKTLLGIFSIAFILMLASEKFTGFLHIVLLFFTVYSFQHTIKFNKKMYLRIILGSIVFVIFTGGLVYYHYTDLINNISTPVTDLVLMRLTEQGQVWWYIDMQMDLAANINHINEFFREISVFFQFGRDDFDLMHSGIYKMMEVMRGQDYVVKRIIAGSRFTEGYPAVGLYYFGYIGLMFSQILFGFLYGIWAGKFYVAIRNYDLLSCLLYYKIWSALNQASVMGNFYELFKPTVLLYIVIIYGISKWKQKRQTAMLET